MYDGEEIQEDIFLEGDDQGNDPQDRVQIIFESNDIEDLYEEVEEEDEGEPPQKKPRSDPGVSSQVLPTALNPSYDAIEFFCLSLAEPIRRMDFLNQQKAKEKIFAVINEQLSASFSK